MMDRRKLEVVPLVNRLAGRFRHVVLTQDWHTADHSSFASQHPGKKPFDTVARLATDFCVAWSALDARRQGFTALVIEDACRGIDTQGSLAKAWADMKSAGVKRIQSSHLL